MADTQRAYVRIGRIVKPQGIKGEVKMAIFTDDPEILLDLDVLYLGRQSRDPRPHSLLGVRFHKGYALLTLEGVIDRNEAELLRGVDVFIPQEWLPPLEEGEFYVHQILGLRVVTLDGEELGTVKDVMFTGANEVYVVHGESHGEVLLPAIDEVIREIDLDAGTMRVQVLDGLM